MIRGISEPSTEVTVRGSREGFTEAIRVNISMVRRRLKSPALAFEMLTAGKTTQTAVCLCYMQDRVSRRLLDDIRARIQDCPLEAVLESGYIQPFLENKRRSLFTSVEATERPDTLCGKVLEGRIGVLVDGTPLSWWFPPCLWNIFSRWTITPSIRCMRASSASSNTSPFSSACSCPGCMWRSAPIIPRCSRRCC